MSDDDQVVRQRAGDVEPTIITASSTTNTIDIDTQGDVLNTNKQTSEDDDDDEPIDPIRPDFKAAEKLHQGTGHVPPIIDFLNEFLPPRWVNWIVRLFTGLLLVSGFTLLIYLGPLALVLMVSVVYNYLFIYFPVTTKRLIRVCQRSSSN
ncbi:unnamed protein product [Schistosoma margrebowiei]|uniref:Uncharacterized protein n=1 Tax=Schistosoma margrebowiei TaxID=48269 RepID=A0A183LYV8_9TREM|nr:unnamed protein product [Schistosoma margrebowiei]